MSSDVSPQPPPPVQYGAPRPKRRIAAIVAITVIVVIVVLAAISFAFLRSTADLRVNVFSTHLLTISYTLSVGEKLVESGTLDFGQYLNYSATYHWWFSDNATLEISATSTGGLLGSITDTGTVEMVNGGSYTVNLFI